MKEAIKAIIKDFHNRGVPQAIERKINIPLNSGKIITIIGARRAGKTYVLYQAMTKIKDITNIIYINFEDERLEISAKEMNQILEAYFEMYPNKKEEELYFFFDEIQEITGWEKFIRRIYDTVSKNIFITGSSSKLLSKEIATSLRGRTITYEVFPLSFKEYLRFKNTEEDIYSTKGKARMLASFDEYLQKGGFPELISMNQEIYEKSLGTYFEVMIYRDIIERYSITDPIPLKKFIKKLISNTAKEFTINKVFNSLKSEGIKISKDTIYKFLDYCNDAYLILPLTNFSETTAKRTIKKAYSIDTGLSSLISFALSKEKGRLFENIIFLELKRKEKEIYYYKGKSECDFIIKNRENTIQAIQACCELTTDNQQREINGLKEAMNRFKLQEGLILTCSQEKTIDNIRVMPAYKWLMLENQ